MKDKKKEREKCYVYNIFTKIKKKILNSKLLQAVIYGKKIILVKVQIRISNNLTLRICCEKYFKCSTSQKIKKRAIHIK